MVECFALVVVGLDIGIVLYQVVKWRHRPQPWSKLRFPLDIKVTTKDGVPLFIGQVTSWSTNTRVGEGTEFTLTGWDENTKQIRWP